MSAHRELIWANTIWADSTEELCIEPRNWNTVLASNVQEDTRCLMRMPARELRRDASVHERGRFVETYAQQYRELIAREIGSLLQSDANMSTCPTNSGEGDCGFPAKTIRNLITRK
jgi:hypothetical protein